MECPNAEGRGLSIVSRRGCSPWEPARVAGFAAEKPAMPKICIFSKHLQWLRIGGGAVLAAEAGFDGVDITVRDA